MKRSLATVFSVSSSALLVLGLSACGGGSSDAASTDTSSSAASSSTSSAAPSDTASSSTAAAADSTLVGSGCASYAAAVPSGAGSVAGMAMDPVATAASNNPLLKTLTAAVSGQLNPNVNLVDTLNGSQFTVFAPVDDAFAKLPAATVDSLKTDTDSLTKILTYHVVAGQLDPTAVVGTHATVEGGDLTVTGSGDNLQVNGANVICGGVKTANATVYLIDTVLTPPAS